MKSAILALVTLVMSMILVVAAPQQSPSSTLFGLYSVPPGATVTMDGSYLGRTNAIVHIPVGFHTFVYSFPGFSDYTTSYVVTDVPYEASGAIVTLPDGPLFTHLQPPFENRGDHFWVGYTNQLQLSTPSGLLTFDADTRTTYLDVPAPAIRSLSQQFNLTDQYTTLSPSQRYFVYETNTNKHAPTETDPLIVSIYDNQTNKTIVGTFNVPPARVYPTYLIWSRNEEWAAVSGDISTAFYFHLKNDQLSLIDGSYCTLDNGDTWSVLYTFTDMPFSGPDNQGRALIKTHSGRYSDETGYTCIVDLNTSHGTLIPIPNPIGAVFSSDDQSVYVMNTDGIAVYNIQSKQITWLNTDLKYMTHPEGKDQIESHLYKAMFSNTAQYAVISLLIENIPYEWIYKVPPIPRTPETPTVMPTPITATPNGGSVPDGNQIGG